MTRTRTSLLLLMVATLLARETRRFPIYDNMFYKGKPDTVRGGLIVSNILYENLIWPPGQDESVLPDRGAYEALVRSHNTHPGPFVIDIEKLPLKGPSASHNLEILATLADWARAAAPGAIVGFYGSNTLTRVPPSNVPLARELARHVSAFFPPMYTFDNDQAAWAKRAQAEAEEARALDPRKPVYFYLWPQYHDNTPQQFQFIRADYWKFQLETARRYSDGIVLWSPSRYEWDDGTGWWRETLKFVRSIKP